MARYDRPKAVNDIVGDGVIAIKPPSTNVVFGMTLMTIGMLLAPFMDVIAKYLGSDGHASPAVVTFIRFLVQAIFLFVLLVALRMSGSALRLWPKNIAGNLLRGALMGIAAFLFFTAVTYMPVADAIAIFFVEPFILTVLSAVLLGETVGWRRRMAVLVGFGGALLIIQPSFNELGFVTLLPVATAFIFANYLILTRKIAADDEPLAMQFTAGIGGTIIMAFALIIGGQLIDLPHLVANWPDQTWLWGLLVLLGLIGTGTHLLIVMAFARAPAAILAPFQYIEIISATFLGLWIFGDFPNAIKWLGITIIVGSGIYIFWREAHLSKEEKAL